MSLWVRDWVRSCKQKFTLLGSEAKGSSGTIWGLLFCREVSQQETPPAVSKLSPKKRKLKEIAHLLPRSPERRKGGESQGQRSGASKGVGGEWGGGIRGWLGGGSEVTSPAGTPCLRLAVWE